MGIEVRKIFEYDLICDTCGCEEVLHTGEGDVFVHDINTAIKEARFHRSRGKLLCDGCFRKRNNEDNA